MNWTLQALGAAPCLLWTAGSWMTGNRRRAGWTVLFVSEFFWALLGWYTRTWTLIGWSAVGLALYARNYRRWRSEAD